MNAWVIAALAVIGLALLVTAAVLLLRARKRPPKPSSIAAVWDRFRADLPSALARAPVVAVLGERLAGKSQLLDDAFCRAAPPRTALADARLGCYAGRGLLAQEIAGDLLEGADAKEALAELWEGAGLDLALVLVVVDTKGPSWSAGGLARLGALVRDRVDLITRARGSPPKVRICLTHVDQSMEGFVEAAALAQQTAPLVPAGRSASDLAATLTPLHAYLPSAIGALDPAALGRFTRFCTTTGARVIGSATPLLDAIFGATTGSPPPSLDGIVLGGGSQASMIGDALTLNAASVERDARALDRKRLITAGAVAAVAAASLVGAYAYHYVAVGDASDALRAFDGAVRRAQTEPQKSWSQNDAARKAEAEAASALEDALAPAYPPLRWAFTTRKQGLSETFLDRVRALYIVPVTQSADVTKRVYALSLLYAANDTTLGDQVKASPEAWAAALDVPVRVVNDYVRWSERRFTGSVPPPKAEVSEVTLDDWQRFLDQLDALLKRDTITAEELSDLQAKGRVLAASAGGTVEARSLNDVIAALRAVRGDEVDSFLGKSAIKQRAPAWVSEHWDALEAVIGMVRAETTAVPAASGKSLRRALDDLAVVGRAEAESNVVYTLPFYGRTPYVVKPDDWSRLLRASRSSIYIQAFLDDVRASGRSLFFARGAEYPSVGITPGRGVRGATRPINGFYTARAVNVDVKPAVLVLDSTLDAAAVTSNDRATLIRAVQAEMARYAASYRGALWDYVASFRQDVTSVAGLRADMEDMVGPASWLTEFWLTVADNAKIDAEGNVYLEPLVQGLTTLSPIVQMMTGDKGKYPILDKYYAIVTPIIGSLDTGAPAPPGPPNAPLEDRLPKLGKFGLALLDPDKPAPLPDVNAFLDSARLLDRAFRTPFLVSVEKAYEYALQNVEKTLDYAYRTDVRPLVAPMLARFPIDPRADTDAGPDELLASVGPKGSFRINVDLLLLPVCKKGITTSCVPKSAVGYRSLRVPSEAMELAGWSSSLAAALWDDGGKPKAMAFQARPRALPEVRRGDVVATLSFLKSGTVTVFAFNQVPAWQSLPVAWSTSNAAVVGVERTDPSTGEKLVLTTEGEGSLWRFYRLLCKAHRIAEGSATWVFETPITFDILPDPWSVVVPPSNRGRQCALLVAKKG